MFYFESPVPLVKVLVLGIRNENSSIVSCVNMMRTSLQLISQKTYEKEKKRAGSTIPR